MNETVDPSQWNLDDLVTLTTVNLEPLSRTASGDMRVAIEGVLGEIKRWQQKASDRMSDEELRNLCLEALGRRR